MKVYTCIYHRWIDGFHEKDTNIKYINKYIINKYIILQYLVKFVAVNSLTATNSLSFNTICPIAKGNLPSPCNLWVSCLILQTMANLRVLLQTHCNFTNNGSLSPSMLKEVLTFSHLAERATYQLILFVTHKAPKICDKISSVPLTRYIKYVIKFKYCIYTNNNLSKKVLHGISYLNKFSVECQHIYIYIHTKIFIPVSFALDYMFKSIYLIC